MHHSLHSPIFVVLSVIVAVFGSWTALDLFRRVADNIGRARIIWLGVAAIVMGVSIWSMHFVAMLGFDPGSAVSYDPLLTFVSLVLAIGSTAGAFFFVASDTVRPKQIVLAGIAMGAGICSMHYVGMAAVQTTVSLGYKPGLVVLSLVIAVVASTAALFAARREHSTRMQAIAAFILGLAIVGMHYTAMAALQLVHVQDHQVALNGAPPMALAIGVAALTVLVLFLALMASLYDQRASILAALEAGGVGYWELDLPSDTVHLSPKGRAVFGLSPDDGISFKDLLMRVGADAREERQRRLAHSVATGADYDIEYSLTQDKRWVNSRGRVVGSRNGRSSKMVGVVLDVTDRRNAFLELKASEARQRLLTDELNHRVKNTLATVQSIARQTARESPSTDLFLASFEARLQALSATHNALTRGGWDKASLREILQNELKPYAAGQVDIRGEDVALGARSALSLGMVFHELATNAAKHGGLSVPGGRLAVEWHLEEQDGESVLRFNWTELGKPIFGAPTRKGFGSRLIRVSIELELGGKAAIDYAEEGLRCTLTLPASTTLVSQAA
ncbi:hypothetical protein ASG43_17610 [Aureimonas sp. Leaf454]|uniref:MHYT domain-containing protein n=1 Tax=Aureimonas sp. Leaf454 TaxID=1736381 RepID=UPI0006FE2039|nr:MHYT domain-containing protein [Aureimonas sp. Leaf454]KQT53656.1 hypothetical protein ASG43_17610 [Aureimonas sp. Leaf454]